MSVNYEIKGMLAKLLATEDIMVEHKKVETACFDVHKRVLTLPMWNASSTVVDLLVAHEVGHSRETPDIDWTVDYKVPGQFVNVCEDVRVEKLMKRRYPGLAKTFFNGYKELSQQDFFSIKDDDVDTFNLADKVNLYFKIGNFLNVTFTEDERVIVKQIEEAETFIEALEAAEALYKYCKQNMDQNTDIDIDLNSQSNASNGQASDFIDQAETGGNQVESDDKQPESGNDPVESGNKHSQSESANDSEESKSNNESGGNKNQEPTIKTSQSLDESIKKLTDSISNDTIYVEVPDIDVESLIIQNKTIHDYCKQVWVRDLSDGNFHSVDLSFKQFKASAQKEVNYLVKEFECRKAADSYARASTSRTGILDCSKLHTYRYNEDIFKKITTLSDGKNHGLVFILDWSGSMDNVILDTVKQLFNLIWFCKKVSVPFEVYAFTNSYPRGRDEYGKFIPSKPSYVKKPGILALDKDFSLMNILTSNVNTRTMEEQMIHIYRMAWYHKANYEDKKYVYPPNFSLSGTPLNDSLICLHKILPEFQKKNKLQKVQCVILTDGDSNQMPYHKEFKHKYSSPYIGVNSVYPGTILRDRKLGTTYKIGTGFNDLTNTLIRNLRDRFSDINFIGIRLIESRYVSSFIGHYYGYHTNEFNKIQGEWKKSKSINIDSSGYHSYFGISSSSLSSDSDFEVNEGATKREILSAFSKSLKVKKTNKKILNDFIGLIV